MDVVVKFDEKLRMFTKSTNVNYWVCSDFSLVPLWTSFELTFRTKYVIRLRHALQSPWPIDIHYIYQTLFRIFVRCIFCTKFSHNSKLTQNLFATIVVFVAQKFALVQDMSA